MSDLLVTKSVLVTKLPRSSVDEASLTAFFEPSLHLLQAVATDDGGGDHFAGGEALAKVTKIEIFNTRSKETNCHAIVTVTFSASAGPVAAKHQFKAFVGHAKSRLNRAFPRKNNNDSNDKPSNDSNDDKIKQKGNGYNQRSKGPLCNNWPRSFTRF
jgi:hypothetical protein